MKWVYTRATQQRRRSSGPLIPHSLATKSLFLSFLHMLKRFLLSAYFNKAQESSFQALSYHSIIFLVPGKGLL